eukprot:312609-Rhodomonas_salina.2
MGRRVPRETRRSQPSLASRSRPSVRPYGGQYRTRRRRAVRMLVQTAPKRRASCWYKLHGKGVSSEGDSGDRRTWRDLSVSGGIEPGSTICARSVPDCA